MKYENAPTRNVDIYIAGDFDIARQVCREYCMDVGMCVNVQAADYIYTGGSETGVKVGLINYPRFPMTYDHMMQHATVLAAKLMERLCQHSYTIVDPAETHFYSRRP